MAFFDEGIYDPLTGLLAPLYFYESSQRLISWAERSGRHTALILLELGDLEDEAIIKCAVDLGVELRGGDLLARMSEKQFVLHMIGDLNGARQLIFRLENKIKADFSLSAVELKRGEEIASALMRLGV
ncbi:MAG: GGDEF domain-containing protein [Actinobacteria bacterium]|nr:GGDEF domain-containing protein [Actinomycetota bacterium]